MESHSDPFEFDPRIKNRGEKPDPKRDEACLK
jgi:hypothetical protein